MSLPKVALFLLGCWFFLSVGNLDTSILSAFYHYAVMLFVIVCLLIMILFDRFSISWLMLFFPLFFFYMFVVSLFTGGDFLSFSKVMVFLLVVIIASYFAAKLRVETFLKVLVISLFLLSFVNFLVVLLMPEIGVDVGVFEGDWKGVYDQKNSMGRLASLLAVACVLLLLMAKDVGVRLYCALFAISAFYFSYYSGSRTALASSFITIFIIVSYCFLSYFYNHHVKEKRAFSLILFLEIALVVFFFINATYVVNLYSSSDGLSVMGYFVSLTGRVTIWDFALNHLSGVHAVFGYGLDNFWTEERFSILGPMKGMGDFYPHDSHNGYIDILIQGGWLGAILYAVFFLLVILCFLFGDLSKNVKLCAFGFFVLFFVSNLTESYVTKSTNIISFLFVYSVALCFCHSARLMNGGLPLVVSFNALEKFKVLLRGCRYE